MTHFPFKALIAIVSLGLLFSCKQEAKYLKTASVEETLFIRMPSDSTGIHFINAIENQKNFNIFKYRNFYNGGGVAIGDVNNDGLPDVYLTANMGKNKLYLNQGDFKFKDISESAGVSGNKPWSTGVTMADINADGWLDIYVSNAGNLEGNNHDNDLYINNGPSPETGTITFTEKAAEYNLAKTGFSTHASFFDYDKDGDLDAYILNNSNIPVSSLGYAEQRDVRAQDWEGVPYVFRGVGDMLLRNDNGKFIDVSEKAGIYGSLIGFGLGVLVSDINGDLYPDIYVSNDFYERDYLYINNQDGTFTEDIKNWISHLCLSAMGVDMADINNDGLADIFVTDMLPEGDQRTKSVMEFEGYNIFKLKQSKDFSQQYIQNTLQLNNGNGSFSEVAYYGDVAKTDWSWAGLIFDMNNDGWRDIFVTNGINHDLTDLDFVDFFANEIMQEMALTGKKESIDSIINKMPIKPQPNFAFRNMGNIKFENAAPKWGLDTLSMSNGAAYGDLDNDGDLDLVVNNVNMNAFIYQNRSKELTENNHVQLKLVGKDKNTFGIGSIVRLYYHDKVVMQEMIPSRGFQSSMDYVMTLGLGEADKIDSLRVIWPDDSTELLLNPEINQTHILRWIDANDTYHIPKSKPKKRLLKNIKQNDFLAHKENSYQDFDYEGLLAKSLSQEGPALAIGDIDGDGNQDAFIGGSKGQSGITYLQKTSGILSLKKQVHLQKDQEYEDTAAAFFDADGDGDLDLIVGSGGNETGKERDNILRLYLNNGSGTLKQSTMRLPSTFQNIATIAAQDFDNDNDIDLYIGSRSIVGTYGVDPKHLLLENNGDGTFTDATQRRAFDIQKSGMVTDAQWGDLNGDGKPELVTVSDWGAPHIYRNTGKQISKIASNLDSLGGWWNTVTIVDLDQDGDQDLILGNQGSNVSYKATPENPMRLYINDFDGNGTIEQITTRFYDGKYYPLHQKQEMTEQLVSLKKQNIKASEYARKSIDELFPAEVFKRSIVKTANTMESVIAINQGNFQFDITPLPPRVQFSCICGITCTDLNQDGHLDLIMGGNNYEFKPQYSRLDASYGHVLLGDGKANFTWQDYDTSGFFVKGEIKHIAKFQDKEGKTYILLARNNATPKVYGPDV